MTEEGNLIQGRYRLERPLGRGGMAEVWRAVDERLERPVAIKFLTGRYVEDPEFLVRFFSEAQSVAGISDANVVPVLDFGDAESGPFLVMELLDGGTLQDLTGQQLPVERAVALVAEAASGAGAAHAAGIVHRDIKPSNILINSYGTVKLADFGIATLEAGENLTMTGTAIGSPLYISPEGAQANSCEPPSDVYSFGVVLYELLAGRPPFADAAPTALAIAHVDREPEPPSAHRPDLPPWLDALVMRCLAKNPAERYQDGNELAAALRAGEAGTSAAAKAEAPVSKRKLIAALAGTALALALGGFLLASPGSDSLTPTADAETQAERTRAAEPSPSSSEDTGDDAELASYGTEDGASPTPTPSPTNGDDEGEGEDEGRDGSDEAFAPTGPSGPPGSENSSSEDPYEEEPEPSDEPEPVETTDEEPAEEEPEPPAEEEPSEEEPEPEPSDEPEPSQEGEPEPAPSTEP